jgi:hypothetical protein
MSDDDLDRFCTDICSYETFSTLIKMSDDDLDRFCTDIRYYETFSTLINISDNDLDQLQIFAPMNILYLNQDV